MYCKIWGQTSLLTLLNVLNFGVSLESLFEPFLVSTPIGESVSARRVYRNCLIAVLHRVTLADLIEIKNSRF